MKTIKLFLPIILASANLCLAQQSFYSSEVRANNAIPTQNITTTWEDIKFGSIDFSYMFGVESHLKMFNIRIGPAAFIIDRTKPLEVITKDGNTTLLNVISFESLSNRSGHSEKTNASYNGNLDVFNNNIDILRFYVVGGKFVDFRVGGNDQRKITSAYSNLLNLISVSKPAPVAQTQQTQQPQQKTYPGLMTVYVDENRRQTLQPAGPATSPCMGNCHAAALPCDVCNRQAQTNSYMNTTGGIQQNDATVQCDLLRRNFADGCLNGRAIPANDPMSFGRVQPNSAGLIPCDVTNPRFGDACLSGRSAPQTEGVHFNSNNLRPFTQVNRGNMPATELYNEPNRQSMSAMEMYQGQRRNTPRTTDYRPAPGTDWTRYVSIPSAFGNPATVVIDEQGSRLIINNELVISRNNQSGQPARVPAPAIVPDQIINRTLEGIKIDGFWGLQFGMPQQDAMDFLYLTKRITRNNVVSANEEAVLLENIKLANIDYDNATLMFKEGVITSGLFTKAFGSGQLASNEVNRIKESLTQKYGNPKIKGDTGSSRYYWHDDANSRSIMLELKNPTPSYYGIDLFYVDRGLSRIANSNTTQSSGANQNMDY